MDVRIRTPRIEITFKKEQDTKDTNEVDTIEQRRKVGVALLPYLEGSYQLVPAGSTIETAESVSGTLHEVYKDQDPRAIEVELHRVRTGASNEVSVPPNTYV